MPGGTSAVRGDDGRGHGGERALAGGDGVGGALDEAEHVGDADLGGEVVHLVVHEEAEAFDGDSGAEAAVEGGGAGDGVALGVDDGEVGGLGGLLCGVGCGRRRQEAGGADEVFADGVGLVGSMEAAPGGGVLRFGHLLEGKVVEVGVAEVVAAVHVGAAEGFGDDVDLRGAAVGAEFGEVVAGEDVEDLDEDDAAGGWWRRGDDVVAAVVAVDGLAVFDLVGGEVFGGDEAAAGFLEGGDLLGHRSFVERRRDLWRCA